MLTKWFAQPQAHGGTRHRLFSRTSPRQAWTETPYFVDSAPYAGHRTMGYKYGLFGSGMGQEIFTTGGGSYRIAATLGGFKRLTEAKTIAEDRQQGDPMTTTHTPGPWTFARIGTEYWIADGPISDEAIPHGTNIVAKVRPVSSGDHHQANAALIAAAPDLLAALEQITDHAQYMVNMEGLDQVAMHLDWFSLQQRITEARAAILKARGTE